MIFGGPVGPLNPGGTSRVVVGWRVSSFGKSAVSFVSLPVTGVSSCGSLIASGALALFPKMKRAVAAAATEKIMNAILMLIYGAVFLD